MLCIMYEMGQSGVGTSPEWGYCRMWCVVCGVCAYGEKRKEKEKLIR